MELCTSRQQNVSAPSDSENISRGLQSQMNWDASPRTGYIRLHKHPAPAPGPGPERKGQGQVLRHQATVSLVTQRCLSQLNPSWNLGLIFLSSGVKSILQEHKCKFSGTLLQSEFAVGAQAHDTCP